jgi:hypothetical protein
MEKKVNQSIVFDSVPENDEGWYEVKRDDIEKMVDGLIPMVKHFMKSKNTGNPAPTYGDWIRIDPQHFPPCTPTSWSKNVLVRNNKNDMWVDSLFYDSTTKPAFWLSRRNDGVYWTPLPACGGE